MLKIRFKFSWGFSVRLPGTSASEPTLKLPPPTTLIGALAKGLAHTLNLPEVIIHKSYMVSTAEILNEVIKSAHLTLLVGGGKSPLWSIISDVTRMQALQYLQPKYWNSEYIDTWFGVHSVGKVYIPSALAEIVYIIDKSKAVDILGEDWNSVLLKSAFSMTAIGVKESIISIDDIEIAPIRCTQTQGYVTSRYYFPMEAVDPSDLELLRDELMCDEYWDHRDRRTRVLDPSGTMCAERIPYIIPLMKVVPRTISEKEFSYLKFRLSKEGIALTSLESIDEALKRGEFIITLRKWLT